MNETVIQTDAEDQVSVEASSQENENCVSDAALKPASEVIEVTNINYLAINNAIDKLADGGTIILAVDNVYNMYLTEKNILITKNMTIMSATGITATISGKIAGATSTVTPHIFVLSPGVHLTLLNIVIKQIGGPDDGSIFYNDVGATVDLINVRIKKSLNENSVPIVNVNGIVNIINSTFEETANAQGDLIQNQNILNIINTSFTGVSGRGSDISAPIRNSGNLTISNSIFSSMEGDVAGVIYNSGNLVIVNNSRFTDNKAAFNGGVIYNEGNAQINCSIFSRNAALGGDGGVIYNSGVLFVSNATFYNNNASSRGGAIYSNNKCTVVDSVFSYCRAMKGGVIYSEFDMSSLNLNNVLIRNNTAYEDSLIYITESKFTIRDSEFRDNTAIDSAVLKNDGLGTIINTIFDNNGNNETTKYIIENYLYLNIINTTFSNNKAEKGGAIYNKVGTIFISKSNFFRNRAQFGGAIYNIMRGTVTISESNFTSNVAIQIGGVIYGDGGNFRISSSAFDSNSATAASALYFANNDAYDESVYATIENSEFLENRALDYRIIYNNISTTIKNSLFGGDSKVSYIYNDKSLYVEGNRMSPRENAVNIFNNGVITSPVYFVILDNTTIEKEINEHVAISAVLLDDMNNTIAGNDIVFTSNGETYRTNCDVNGVYTNDDVCEYDNRGYYTISADVGDAAMPIVKTAMIAIPFEDSPIIVDYQNVTYGTPSTVVITLPYTTDGTINVTMNGVTTEHVLDRGTVTLDLGVLGVGTYDMSVSYSGDDTYSANSTSFVLAVSKLPVDNTNFKITVEDNDLTVSIDIPEDATGEAAVYIDGSLQPITIVSGEGSITTTLENGPHNVRLYYSGDDNYAYYDETVVVMIGSKVAPNMRINVKDVYYGEAVNVEVVLNPYATGKINLTINNVSDILNIYAGKVSTSLILPIGEYDIVAVYEGDNRFEAMTLNSKVNVLKASIADNSIVVGSDGLNITVDVNLPADNTGNVTVVVNGTSYKVNLTNGTGRIVINQTSPDNYNVTVKYTGDGNYEGTEITQNVALKLDSSITLIIDPSEVEFAKAISGKVTVNDGATGNVTLTVNGLKYVLSVEEAKDFRIPNKLPVGNNIIYVSYSGDGKYNPSANSSAIKIIRGNIDYNSSAVLNITPGDRNVTVSVKIPVDATGAVSVSVDGSSHYLPTVDGVGSITLPVSPGTHQVVVNYTPINNYNPFLKVVNVTINDLRKDPNINFTIADVKYRSNIVVKVQLPSGIPDDEILVIKVAGQTVYVPVSQAKHNYYLPLVLPVGENYEASLYYGGDDLFKDSTKTTTFNVLKDTISSNAIEILAVDRGIDVSLTFPTYINDNVTVNVNGTDYIIKLKNGVGELNIPEMVGKYNVTVVYPGNSNYEGITKTAMLNVSDLREITNLTIAVEDGTYGDPIYVNVSANENATGLVTITVNDKEFEGELENGKAVIVIDELPVGDYDNINVTYSGDSCFKPQANVTRFKVNKATIDLDQALTFNVTDRGFRVEFMSPENTTGIITITVNDVSYLFNISGGQGVLFGLPCDSGNYTVGVSYCNDSNINDFNKTVVLTVPDLRQEPTINVAANPVKYGDPVVVDITLPSDANGQVIVNIDDQEFYGEVINGVASVTTGTFPAGNHTIKVTFSGDNSYFPATVNTTSVEIAKTSVNPDDVVEIIGGDREVLVVVDVPYDMTGTVKIAVGDDVREYDLSSAVGGVMVIMNTDEGNYSVVVNYTGDGNYDPFEVNKSVVIKDERHDAPISLNLTDNQFGESSVIVINAPAKLKTNVTVFVDNKFYIVPVSAGSGRLIVDNLATGNHSVEVIYGGNNVYKGNSSYGNFEVIKYVTSYGNIVSVIDGNNLTVNVDLPESAFGTVNVTINGTDYVFDVIKGKGNVTVPLESDIYSIVVNYTGDDNFDPFAFEDLINMKEKSNTTLIISVNETSYGKPVAIDITMNKFVTDTIAVKVGDATYDVAVSGGKGNLMIDGLAVGDYNISAKFLGNGRFNGVTNVSSVKVSKSAIDPDSSITIETDELNITVNVDLPEDTTGKVVVTVDGTDYEVDLTNGTGSITIPLDAAGDYDVKVNFSDDSNYDPFVESESVSLRNTPEIEIGIEGEVKHGENVTVKVTLPDDATGDVTIAIGDNEVTVPVSEAKDGVTIPVDAPVGDGELNVIYSGDGKYANVSSSVPVVVESGEINTDSSIAIVGGDRNVTVIVDLPDDAAGNVTVTVGGEEYEIPLVNGKGNITIPVESGEEEITVNFTGDDNYDPFEVSKTVEVSDLRDEPEVNITVSDVVYGEPITVVVDVPEDAAGNVTVTVDGKEYVGEVEDGRAVITTDPIDSTGNHTIAIDYSGDDKYQPMSESSEVTADKAAIDPDSAIDIRYDNSTIMVVVDLPEDATGTVDICVDGVKYSVNASDDGKATVIVPITGEDHSVSVNYTGDDNYMAFAKNQTINTSDVRPIPSIDISIGNATSSGPIAVNVSLPFDAKGEVTVTIGDKNITVPVVDGKAEATLENISAGNHTIRVDYSGDANYKPSSKSQEIEVAKPKLAIDDIEIETSLNDDNTTSIVITSPEIPEGLVNLTINGTTYQGEFINNTCNLTVPVDAGLYNVTLSIEVEGYEPAELTVPVKVTPFKLTVNDLEMYYKDGGQLTAVLTEKGNPMSNETLYFGINGVEYARKTDENGTAGFAINLGAGEYNVTVSYRNKDNITVVKQVKVQSTIIAEDLVKIYRNESRFQVTATDKLGNLLDGTQVELNINGVIYRKTVENGSVSMAINLLVGDYVVTVYNAATGELRSFNIHVLSSLQGNDTVLFFKNGTYYVARALDSHGNPLDNVTVSFNINGVFYKKVTDEDGFARLKINLPAGTYIITGIHPVTGEMHSNYVMVLPTLTGSDLTKKYGTPDFYSVRLLNGTGDAYANQVITFNINGVLYNRTTDANGIAKLNINLVPGEYVITAQHGNDGTIISNTIKVKA